MINRETERLLIRNFKKNDWEDLLEMVQQYEASELAKYDYQWPQTAEEIRGVVNWFGKGDSFVAVELKSENKVIGFISLVHNDKITDEKVHSLGYIFNSNYHNKGYAYESCMNILEYLFTELEINRIITGTAVKNERSCNLLNKLGFFEKGQENKSLRMDKEGNPIEFLAAEYWLIDNDWKLKRGLK